MVNVTLVITSESCTGGNYSQLSLRKRLEETVTTVLTSIYYLFIYLFIYYKLCVL